MKGNRDHIDAVKRAAHIGDVIASYGIKLERDGKLLKCCCPFHDDSTPSLIVDPHKDLGVWHCKGECNVGGDVIAFVMKKEGLDFKGALNALAQRFGVTLPTRQPSSSPAKLVASYRYTTADGELIYTIERWEPGKNGRSKDFIQRVPIEYAIAQKDCPVCDATRGTPCAHERRAAFKHPDQVLYGLPALRERAHEAVFIVEGEKCADALGALGVLATTWAGGAQQKKVWTKDFAAPLAGRRIVVIPDNDTGGREIADHICVALKGIAAEARLLDLEMPDAGDDVVDWIAKGHTRSELLDLADEAPLAGTDATWRTKLLRTSTQDIRPSVGNALIALANADPFRGALSFDERALVVMADRALPWDRPKETYPRQVTDDDAVFGAAWCENELKTPISTETFGKALWATARARRRNLLTEHLDRLQWDGRPRIETWLIRHANSADTPFVRAASKAWLISAVARAFRPGCQVDHVLVLESPEQGERKSSILRALAGTGNIAENLPDLDSKDTALILGRAWIVVLDELEGMRKNEVTAMKAFITRVEDVFRPPYDRQAIRVPRGCVFAATTNENEYLKDMTGSRRWWPVQVRQADVRGLLAERDQLWAEAVAAFRGGAPWWFTDSEIVTAAKEETAMREQVDPWEDLIGRKIAGLPWITPSEIFGALDLEPARRTKQEATRIGQIMRKLRWKRQQKRLSDGRREWWWYPPDDHGPPGNPPVTDGDGGSGSVGDTVGDTSPRRQSPMSPMSPTISSRGRARAHAQGELLHDPDTGTSFEDVGDIGDIGDGTSTNAVTNGVTYPEGHPESSVTAAEIWDDLMGGRG